MTNCTQVAIEFPRCQRRVVEGNFEGDAITSDGGALLLRQADRGEPPVFRRLPGPRPQALEQLIHTISQQVGAYLERESLLVRDIENTYLQLEAPDESAMSDLLGHSITYRMAVGPPQAGRKALTLQPVPAREQDNDNPNLAKTAGFFLHAGVAAKAHQRRKLERLCRYIARPAVATDRLTLTR